jgi:hypothetical protein
MQFSVSAQQKSLQAAQGCTLNHCYVSARATKRVLETEVYGGNQSKHSWVRLKVRAYSTFMEDACPYACDMPCHHAQTRRTSMPLACALSPTLFVIHESLQVVLGGCRCAKQGS